MNINRMIGIVSAALRGTELEGEEEYVFVGKPTRNISLPTGFTFVGKSSMNGLDKRFINAENYRRLMVDEKGGIRLFSPQNPDKIVYKDSFVVYMEPDNDDIELSKNSNKVPRAEFWIPESDIHSFMNILADGEVLQVRKVIRNPKGGSVEEPEVVWTGLLRSFVEEFSETDKEFTKISDKDSEDGNFQDFHFHLSDGMSFGRVSWRTIRDPRKTLKKIPSGRGPTNNTEPESWSPSEGDVSHEYHPEFKKLDKVITSDSKEEGVGQSEDGSIPSINKPDEKKVSKKKVSDLTSQRGQEIVERRKKAPSLSDA